MSVMTLPTMAARATSIVRDTLAEPAETRSRQERVALVEACGFIAGLFRGFLQGVNDSLAEGVGSRSLRAGLQEGIQTGEFALEQFAALQQTLDVDAPTSLTEALKKATAEVERVRDELASMAAWIDSPPPVPDLEKLKEASKGPFTPMRN